MKEVLGILPLVVILAAFWFLLVRPARRQRQAALEVQMQLSAGDRVMLTSGIFGTVHTVDADRIELELAPGTVITVMRAAVASVHREDI